MKKMSKSQRLGRKSESLEPCWVSSISSSHLRMAQKMTAVNKDAMAYTSPSTAENQKESEKV